MLNGVEQSYITQRTFDYLSSCRAISFVPVTTRTKQQYERVGILLILSIASMPLYYPPIVGALRRLEQR